MSTPGGGAPVAGAPSVSKKVFDPDDYSLTIQKQKMSGFSKIIIFLDVVFYLGFMAGFVVGIYAARAAGEADDQKKLDTLLPYEVGWISCTIMTFAAVGNAALHLYGVHQEKKAQIPWFQEQAVIMNGINEVFDKSPTLLENAGLPTDFQVYEPEEEYDVGMKVPTELIPIVGSSIGAGAGCILAALGEPLSGLLLMFTCSLVLRYFSREHLQRIRDVTLLMARDNQALLNIAGILKISLRLKKSEQRDRTVVDHTRKFTYEVLADAVMANKHAHAHR